MKLITLLIITLFTEFTFANELQITRDAAIKLGFKPMAATPISLSNTDFAAHSLPWPVSFFSQQQTIGNSMPQYQNYSNEAYYHSGSDLRVARSAQVLAPIDGFLQGNYYSYVTDPNTGEDKKFTKPISEGGDSLYFEITIKSAAGPSFELHHVSPTNLPPAILDLVKKGGGNIKRGEVIGYAAVWPVIRMGQRYDHIHYNLISASGVSMNAEYYSEALIDNSAPVVKNIFAIYKDKKIEITNQKLNGLPSEIIVSAFDIKGENIYTLPPVSVVASWGQSEKVGWDFSKFLLNSLGQFPDIREVFAKNLKLTDGRNFTTLGDYASTVFLYRLKIPSTATSPITLTVKDASDNEKKIFLDIL